MLIHLGEGSKKNLVESTNGGGQQDRIFHTKKERKNKDLKHWILPSNHFETHLFFFQFLGGGPSPSWMLV